jgi:biotin/methionine sulfoxide reductase
MAATRTTVNINWSLQRSHHGEQPFWALVTLACMLGQIGLPGGGFGAATAPTNIMGSYGPVYSVRPCRRAATRWPDFIPVARFSRHAAQPGSKIAYNGRELTYPDIRLVYWAGGNPFHHHQDLNRLRRRGASPRPSCSTSSSGRRPRAWPTSCCRRPPTLERDDIGYGRREPYLIAMKKAREPIGEARDDYWIFSELDHAARAGESTPKAATRWRG